jgi:ribonuclease P protein component
MLSSLHRLTKKEDFNIVKERGNLIHSTSFAFVYLAKDAELPSRFGFVVSTKISKKAVARNRAKRLLREAVRINMDKIVKGYDCVFLAKHLILDKQNTEIVAEVKTVLKKAKITA